MSGTGSLHYDLIFFECLCEVLVTWLFRECISKFFLSALQVGERILQPRDFCVGVISPQPAGGECAGTHPP